jgi:hypothetical protein
MRRIATLLLGVVAVAMMAAPSAVAKPPSGVLRGVLLTPSGAPARGVVQAWLDDPPSADAVSYNLPLVAQAKAGRDGRFTLRLALTKRLRAAARRNDGYVDLQLASQVGELVASWDVPVVLLDGDGRATARVNGAWPVPVDDGLHAAGLIRLHLQHA